MEKVGETFSWNEIGQGRGGKIVALNLTFHFASELSDNPIIPCKQLEQKVDRVAGHQADASAVIEQLRDIGIHGQSAELISKTYDLDYVQEKIALVERTAKKREIKNVSGFVLKAIEQDWTDDVLDVQRKKSQLQYGKKAADDQGYQISLVRREYQQYRDQCLGVWFDSLSNEKINQLNLEFLASLKGPVLRAYKRKKVLKLTDSFYRSFFSQQAYVYVV